MIVAIIISLIIGASAGAVIMGIISSASIANKEKENCEKCHLQKDVYDVIYSLSDMSILLEEYTLPTEKSSVKPFESTEKMAEHFKAMIDDILSWMDVNIGIK